MAKKTPTSRSAKTAGSEKTEKSEKTTKAGKVTKPAKPSATIRSDKGGKKEPVPARKVETKKIAAKPEMARITVRVALGGRKPAITVAPGARIVSSSSAAAHAPLHHKTEESEGRKLTRKELDEIRETLLRKRSELLHGIRRELSDYRERSNSKSSDEADKATDAYDEDLSFEIALTSDEELSQIETALSKIENGTYGLCEGCQRPVSPSRLKILPYAVTCVACRDDEERARKREDGLTPWGLVGDEAEEEPE